jgi:hypothetical protein
MKVMVLVKATPDSEKGLVFDEKTKKMFEDMGKFNDELVKAGIVQAADGLKPSSHGKRIQFAGGKVSVIDGPFAETKELVAGFWIWKVKSVDEAVEWARRCPNPMPGEEGMLEIRPFYELEDFGEAMSDEHRGRAEDFNKQAPRARKPKRKARKTPPKAKARAKGKSEAKSKARSKKSSRRR